MSQQPNLLRAFNNHFIEFVDDVVRVFPDDVDIQTAKNALISIKKANPKLIVKIWKEYIGGPYADEIARGDLEFFIAKDYSTDMQSVDSNNAIMSKIDLLRIPISKMGADNKNIVITYIQNLTKLATMQ